MWNENLKRNKGYEFKRWTMGTMPHASLHEIAPPPPLLSVCPSPPVYSLSFKYDRFFIHGIMQSVCPNKKETHFISGISSLPRKI